MVSTSSGGSFAPFGDPPPPPDAGRGAVLATVARIRSWGSAGATARVTALMVAPVASSPPCHCRSKVIGLDCDLRQLPMLVRPHQLRIVRHSSGLPSRRDRP